MPERYVKNVGAYLPLLRLERKIAASALAWSGLGVPRSGHRSVAGWDEDALTMAVEAARVALNGHVARMPSQAIFASTSAPFRERQHATILVDALHLDSSTTTLDVAGSRRCGVAALRSALLDPAADALVVAGERRGTRPGSSLQLAWGDGAAAVLVGDTGQASLVSEACLSVDLVDVYASEDHPAPYASEERFIRDEAVARILAPVVRTVCKKGGMSPADIAIAVVHEPVSGTYRSLAAATGLKVVNLSEEVTEKAGDLGAAHVLFGLGLALERAGKGDRILVAGFGSGCDALILEATGTPAKNGPVHATLAHGSRLENYTRFLSLTGSIDLDWGPRSEVDQKTSAAVLARHGRDMHGFVGGRDARGNVQFPKSLIPVSPEADRPEPLDDIVLAEVGARVVSITADRLNYTPDPPFHFGLVQFENGARVSMEYCDLETSKLEVGDPVCMRFRIKSFDRKRGFRTYFWKAAPMQRPALETK